MRARLLVHTVKVLVDAVEQEAHQLSRVVLLVTREHWRVLPHDTLDVVGHYYGVLSRPRLGDGEQNVGGRVGAGRGSNFLKDNTHVYYWTDRNKFSYASSVTMLRRLPCATLQKNKNSGNK